MPARIFAALTALVVILGGCATALPDAAAPARAEASRAMVAAAHPIAVEAGLEVLRRGGSAADAAVAVQSALGLVEPQSSGLGGGAFLLHYDAETKSVSVYDGRETAPSAAGPDLFLGEDGAPWPLARAVPSGRSVGAPGAMDALALAQADHGRLAWPSLFEPVARLAEQGFPVPERLHRMAALLAKRDAPMSPALRAYLYDAAGAPWPVGRRLANPDYAATLRALARNPRALWEGPIAAAIVEAVAAGPDPGALSLADLAAYRARKTTPICRPYRVYLVCGPPPPASGGVAINAILGLLERHAFILGGPDEPANWSLLAEAQRLAYADRDQFVADPDFVKTPVQGLLSPAYLDARARLIKPRRAMARALPGDPFAHEPGRRAGLGRDATLEAAGTSHFVVVDAWGDAVSMTTTVETIFGSRRMAAGFVLNNQLTDFSLAPRDESGRLAANAPGPRKRPRSSMSPMIVLDQDGQLVLAVGSPGGSAIIGYVAKTLVGVLDWGLAPQAAVELPNLVARGDELRLEAVPGFEDLGPALAAFGHALAPSRGEESGLHAIRRRPDATLEGAADPRREGVVATP